MSGLEADKLINITITHLKSFDYDVNNMDTDKPYMRKRNIWFELASRYSEMYFGRPVLIKDCLNICCWWNRNTKGFKDSVIKVMY